MIGSGLKALALENGLQLAKGVAYGRLHGFAVTMSEGSGYKQIVFATQFTDPSMRRGLMTQVDQANIQCTYLIRKLNISSSFVRVVFEDNPRTLRKMGAFLRWFLPMLHQFGGTPADRCSACGTEITDGRWLMVKGVAYHLHQNCAEKVRRDMMETGRGRKEQPVSSRGIGILIASLVAVAGAVLGTFIADLITVIGMINSGELYGLSPWDAPAFIFHTLFTNPDYFSSSLGNVVLVLMVVALVVFVVMKNGKAKGNGTKVFYLD